VFCLLVEPYNFPFIELCHEGEWRGSYSNRGSLLIVEPFRRGEATGGEQHPGHGMNLVRGITRAESI